MRESAHTIQHSEFFQNKFCEYFPCHFGVGEINCLFCFCPLYSIVDCPGSPEWFTSVVDGENLHIKDCSHCVFPHKAENYIAIIHHLSKHKGQQ